MGASKRLFTELREIESEDFVPYKPKLDTVLQFINNIIKDVENGNKEALEVFISFKTIADQLERAKKTINDIAINEAYKYNSEKYNGYKITIVEGRRSFNFKDIPEIEAKEKELKEIQNKYKHAFDGVLKGTVQIEGTNWIDSNGEVLPLPLPTYGKTYLKIEK